MAMSHNTLGPESVSRARIPSRLLRALLLVLALGSSARAQLPPAPMADAWRASYAALARKLDTGQTVRIGMFGGSVSRGAATFPNVGIDPYTGIPYDYSPTGPNPYYDERHSLRAVFQCALQARVGKRSGQVRVLNMCLGGTGSYEGTFRYSLNVAPADLDLLVIEFGINDIFQSRHSWANPLGDGSIPRMLESIVQQARADNPNIAFLFAISTARDFYLDLGSDLWIQDFHRSRVLHQSYAIQRGIPFVDITDEFFGPVPPVTNGPLFNGPLFAQNRVHMTPEGHRVYGEALARVVGNCLEGQAFPFPPPVILLPDVLAPFPAHPTVIRASDIVPPAGFQIGLNGEPAYALPIFNNTQALYATQPGAELVVPFQGRTVSIWWQSYFGQLTPNGSVALWVDDNYHGAYQIGGQYFPAAEPLPKVQNLGLDLDPTVTHTLRIGVLGSNSTDLRLALHAIFVEN